MGEFWPRWRCRLKPFTSSYNQKEDKNQSKNNKQPEMPENQTAWNSDSQGIKETVNQTNQTGRREQKGGWTELGQGGGLCRWGWLNGKLRLRADWTTAGVATVGDTPSLT